MRKLKVNLDDVIEALDTHEPEMEFYLDSETGGVLLVADPEVVGEEMPEIDGNRHLRIAPLPSHEGYRDMEDFIDTVDSPALQQSLAMAIQGRGAFRRFRDVLLRYPEERERWFAFKRERMEERALDWLKTRNIEPE